MAPRRRLLILGSTGSIGTQALEVCSCSDELELVGLSAERSWEPLLEQARLHGVRRIALADEHAAARAGEAWTDGEVLAGAEGLVRLVVESRKASTSLLQRRLRLGYGRAARLLDLMQRDGIISAPDGSKPREVLKPPNWLREVDESIKS